MASVAVSCRLNVYLARDAPIGVILRRGPSDWCRLSLWHTDRDEIEHGQWFRGRIYERRCDVSPDGSLFVYFARKSSRAAARDTWLAISRPPWLTALSLWFVGGTYFAGGCFHDSETVWLGGITESPDQGSIPSWLRVSRDPLAFDRSRDWTNRTVYVARLLRDGWVCSGAPDDCSTWEHADAPSRRTLIMTLLGESARYSLRIDGSGDIHHLGRADWADWDQRGRLIIARGGSIALWESPDSIREVEDFGEQVPDPTASAPEAQIWPSRPVEQ